MAEETTFDAQMIVRSGRNHAAQQIELAFENAQGERLAMRMSAEMAANALIPILLSQFSHHPPPHPGGPVPMQTVERWQVGTADHAADVVFALNDAPFLFAMPLPTAVEFTTQLWDQVRIASQWKPPTRQ
jgi:hypothetical protein